MIQNQVADVLAAGADEKLVAERNPERLLAYENVVERIKGQLLSGDLLPGDKLPTIADRARNEGLSHGTVREAYRVLEHRGVLEVVQGRGTFVVKDLGSSDDVLKRLEFHGSPTRAQLLEARRLLEPHAAALAAGRASKAERAAILEASLTEEQHMLDVRQWSEHNLRFHHLIVLAAHNPVIAQMVTAIYELFEKSKPHPAEDPVVREKGRHFHRLIAMAIAEGDAAGAESLMYQHIESVEKIL